MQTLMFSKDKTVDKISQRFGVDCKDKLSLLSTKELILICHALNIEVEVDEEFKSNVVELARFKKAA